MRFWALSFVLDSSMISRSGDAALVVELTKIDDVLVERWSVRGEGRECNFRWVRECSFGWMRECDFTFYGMDGPWDPIWGHNPIGGMIPWVLILFFL